jgi:ATP-dependent Clp protease ATP-binding subunit ClpA
VFERFTDPARRVLVRAQDEAREMRHEAIGTEHLLLGLLANDTTSASRAMILLGLDLAGTRKDVLRVIGGGKASPVGHLPFTARARKTLELAVRETIQLGETLVAPEHLLLAIVAEGDGVAVHVLHERGIDRGSVWTALGDAGFAPAEALPSPPSANADARRDAEPTDRSADMPPPPSHDVVAAATCPNCHQPLVGSLNVSVMEANVEGGGQIVVPIAFCGRCGAALQAIVTPGERS